MPKDSILEYDATAGNNTDVGGVNINEGCAPSTINDAIRELMSHLAELDQSIWGGTAGGTADALTLTPTPAVPVYEAGQKFRWIAGAANNTGAATIAISGLAAKALQNDGAALSADDIVAGKMYEGIYDGTQFQIQRVNIPSLIDDTTPQLGGNLDANSNLTNLPTAWGNTLAPHESLVCKYVSATTVDIDADAIYLRDTSDYVYKASSVNLTADITASGANGLDTGSEASSTWYYLWTIYNPETDTVASLLSTSATSPTMPSGYTFKGLVGAVYNDSGSDFDDFFQEGNDFRMESTTLVAGLSDTPQTSIDLSTVIPPIARKVSGYTFCHDNGSSSSRIELFPRSSGNVGMIQVYVSGNASGNNGGSYYEMLLETASTMWYSVNVSTTDGWVAVSGGSY